MRDIKPILPISIAIPTLNRPVSLKQTLTTYLVANYRPAQIIVVDQSTQPDIRKQNKQLLDNLPQDINGIYIHQAFPSSTHARNRALRVANQDIIIWSDDDIEIGTDILKNVYDIMQDSSVALIAGLNDYQPSHKTIHPTLTLSKKFIGCIMGMYPWRQGKIGYVSLSIFGRFPKFPVKGEVPTQWAMGFFFVTRKHLLNQWNIYWDENLRSFAFEEDLDFSYSYYKHAQKEGLKCIYSDKVHVFHHPSTEYRIPSKHHTFMIICNRYYLAHKHKKGIISIMAMSWYNFWYLILRLVRNKQPEDVWQAICYCVKNHRAISKGHLGEYK